MKLAHTCGEKLVCDDRAITQPKRSSEAAKIGEPEIPDVWVRKILIECVDDQMSVSRVENQVIHVEEDGAVSASRFRYEPVNHVAVPATANHQSVTAVDNVILVSEIAQEKVAGGNLALRGPQSLDHVVNAIA